MSGHQTSLGAVAWQHQTTLLTSVYAQIPKAVPSEHVQGVCPPFLLPLEFAMPDGHLCCLASYSSPGF